MNNIRDLVVIGGGVNGVGIAADAAGRGLSVTLCEMNDLGSATSSNSSKLIHGGLRYLEHYEFSLVRSALKEREVLLKNAPHIMKPLRFILPHRPHLRPAWMIRAGLFLYDHLAKRHILPGSGGIKLGRNHPLKDSIRRGFIYSDGWVNDARLVILCAMLARNHGAEIKPQTRVVSACRDKGIWRIETLNALNGTKETIYTKTLVNAAGPWVSDILKHAVNIESPKEVRLVKGSHIVVPRIHDHPEAYILQNEDGRIVFVIPFEQEYSLIGTTDVDFKGDPSRSRISSEEEQYLIDVVNDHFKNQISQSDIVWDYSGVRPLMADEDGSAQEASRDYEFELNTASGLAPLLSVFGGKITTYRKLAEAATDAICQYVPGSRESWTAGAVLPGADNMTVESLDLEFANAYPWLPSALRHRYIISYGRLATLFLGDKKTLNELGQHFGAGLYEEELRYLIEHEWVRYLDDAIWRRSKLGLKLSEPEKTRIKEFITLQTREYRGT